MKILSDKLKQQIYDEYQNTGIGMPELSRKYNTSISSIYRLRKEIESKNNNNGDNDNMLQHGGTKVKKVPNFATGKKLKNQELINDIVDKNNMIYDEKYRNVDNTSVKSKSRKNNMSNNISTSTSDKSDKSEHKKKVKEDLTEFLEFIQHKKEERNNI